MNSTMQTDATSSLKLILAWAIVGVPLIWGIFHTVVAASQLFG
jgi:hypothetical protein